MQQNEQTIEKTEAQAPVKPAPVPATVGAEALKFMPPALIVAADAGARQGLAYLAKQYAEGGCLPEGLSPQGAIILMVAGIDYGLSPIEAVSKLFLIGGRVTPSAHEMVAQAIRKGVKVQVVDATHEKAQVKLSRDGHPDFDFEYTKADAVKAGLWGKKGPWSNDPRSMLLARAKTQALRAYAPDTLSSLYSDEEVSGGTGYIDPEGKFTPDPSITGDQPKEKIKAFEGRAADKPAPEEAEVAKAKSPEPAARPPLKPAKPVTPRKAQRASTDITAEVKAEVVAEQQAEQDAQFSPEVAPALKVAEPEVVAETVEPEVEIKAGSFLAALVIAAKVPGQDVMGPQGVAVSQLNTAKATGMILEHLMRSVPSKPEALTLIKGYMQEEFGVTESKDLSRLQLLRLAEWADREVQTRGKPQEVADFNPKRGAATKPAGQVEDGQAADYDAEILALFEQAAVAGKDGDANTICEETGYIETAETSTAQVKAETVQKLRALLQDAA